MNGYRQAGFWVIAVAGLAATACFPLPNDNGPSYKTCAISDLDCFMDALVVSESEHVRLEQGQETERVDGHGKVHLKGFDSDLFTSSGGSSGTSYSVPEITSAPTQLTFSEPGAEQQIQLDWYDPNGCRPSFCYYICSRQLESDGRKRCSLTSRCSGSRSDGWTNGRVYMALKYERAPETTTEDLELQIAPVSRPDCEEVTQYIEDNQDDLEAASIPTGPDIAFQQVLDRPVDYSDGSGSSNYCSDFMSCTACSIKACTDVSSGGSCNAWYEASTGGRYACNGCSDCTSAAEAVVSACCPTSSY